MPQKNQKVTYLTVQPDENGQRLDNWLLSKLKSLPKSRIYKIIRSGEVRVNKGRAKASTRVATADEIRIPPIRIEEPGDAVIVPDRVLQLIREAVLYRDQDVLVVNKPSGLASHSGSGVPYGLIDAVRQCWGEDWQLVHRLDRETTGCVLLVRQRELQREFQQAQELGQVEKKYLALLHGHWPVHQRRVEIAMAKTTKVDGERRMQQDEGGKQAVSDFRLLEKQARSSLVEVQLHTGRMHQIRLQAAELGHALVGDDKYGRRAQDQALGLKKKPRLCLHAAELKLSLGGREIHATAALPEAFRQVLTHCESL